MTISDHLSDKTTVLLNTLFMSRQDLILHKIYQGNVVGYTASQNWHASDINFLKVWSKYTFRSEIKAASKYRNILIMARTLPTSENLFVESALHEVCQALDTLWQLNSYIYMQKFITILMKTEKQSSPRSNSPVARFLLVTLVQSRAWEETSVPAPPL